jgi:hypothetical protein
VPKRGQKIVKELSGGWQRRGALPALDHLPILNPFHLVTAIPIPQMKPHTMSHTALSRAFLLLLGAAALVLTAFRFHGSSVVMWSAILNEEKTSHALLASLPRVVRSDE